jgi:hypothetical protein
MAHAKLSEPVIYAKSQWIAAQTDLPLNMKRDMLNLVLRLWPEYWRVIGITDNALEIFATNGFKRVSGAGIQRAHIVKRLDYCNELLANLPSQEAFFAFLREHDRTVICVAGKPRFEGGLVERGEVDWYPVPDGVFTNDYMTWNHTKTEVEFLRDLYIRVASTKGRRWHAFDRAGDSVWRENAR